MRMLLLAIFATVLLPSTALSESKVQVQDPRAITKGEFSQIVLATLATKEAPDLSPQSALDRLIQIELVDEDWNWQADDFMLQRDLSLIVIRLEIPFQIADPDAVVSQDYAEALLRRYQRFFQRYTVMRVIHGESVGTTIDEAIDRAVSPSSFYDSELP